MSSLDKADNLKTSTGVEMSICMNDSTDMHAKVLKAMQFGIAKTHKPKLTNIGSVRRIKIEGVKIYE